MSAVEPAPGWCESALSLLLWLSGAGHFLLLAAALQVPARLRWREELARLSPFNRKLLWVYGAFTVFTIVGFGGLILDLHDELLRGERAALGISAFIGLYWTARLVVDFTVFRHQDWPRGPGFVLGHVLLDLLFVFLAGTPLALLAWHLGGRP